MFGISSTQVAAFEKENLEAFKREMFGRLREKYSDFTRHYDDEALMSVIDTSTVKGVEFGLQTRRGMTQFVSFSVLLDPELFDRREMQDLMAYSGFNADDKVEMLSEFLQEKLRSSEFK